MPLSPAEKQKAYRDRKRRETEEMEAREAELRAMSEEQREQAIRDHWGYASSETRTEAERHTVVARILANLAQDPQRTPPTD
jgi:hypothetical protein